MIVYRVDEEYLELGLDSEEWIPILSRLGVQQKAICKVSVIIVRSPLTCGICNDKLQYPEHERDLFNCQDPDCL